VSIMGKDVKRFHEGLQTWDYHSLKSKINLLLVVKQPSLTPQAHLQANGYLLNTIDGTCLWTTNSATGSLNCKRVNGHDSNLEVYVIFTNRNMRITLDTIWTNRLFYDSENLISVKNTGAGSLRNFGNYRWYDNMAEDISGLSLSAIEMTPFSHNTYWGVGSILRTQGTSRILIKQRSTQGVSKEADILLF